MKGEWQLSVKLNALDREDALAYAQEVANLLARPIDVLRENGGVFVAAVQPEKS